MTANQLYKAYKKDGGTLSFAEFMSREKTKKFVNFDGESTVPENKPLSDSINQVLSKIHQQSGLKTDIENKYIFGIHRGVWIGAGIVGAGLIAWSIYKHSKK